MKKQLLISLLFLGLPLAAMDASLMQEQDKSEQEDNLFETMQDITAQVNRLTHITQAQAEYMSQEEYNALINQSKVVQSMLGDCDKETDIPTFSNPKKVKLILPLLVLLNQDKSDAVKKILQERSTNKLVSLINTADQLGCECLSPIIADEITKKISGVSYIEKFIQNPDCVKKITQRLPIELNLLIGKRLMGPNCRIGHFYYSYKMEKNRADQAARKKQFQAWAKANVHNTHYLENGIYKKQLFFTKESPFKGDSPNFWKYQLGPHEDIYLKIVKLDLDTEFSSGVEFSIEQALFLHALFFKLCKENEHFDYSVQNHYEIYQSFSPKVQMLIESTRPTLMNSVKSLGKSASESFWNTIKSISGVPE